MLVIIVGFRGLGFRFYGAFRNSRNNDRTIHIVSIVVPFLMFKQFYIEDPNR